ncbi:MAG: hypothetical protein KGJ02_04780 [Verrucomicrobiota bacterium]|nr:hypothetical protein [Verrucomicrobiota bacterium]
MIRLLLLFPLCLFSFVCGDAFRAYSDHQYDEDKPSIPPLTTPGQTIFLKGAHLSTFFANIHPHLAYPYILISHISDDSVPASHASHLDDPKLIAWFGINCDGTLHPKFHPIPIGVANAHLPHGNKSLLSAIQQNPPPKQYLAYLNFTIQSFSSERWPLFKLLSHTPFCHRTLRINYESYLRITAAAHFMISPRGLGLDTYRLWESLYLGTIPIVKSSSLDPLYAGLPILIISDWAQVTEPFLREQLLSFANRSFSFEKLSMEYWIQLINSYKGAVF